MQKLRPFTFAYLAALTGMLCGAAMCSDDKKEDPMPADGVSDALHFAFKTPDWERTIDCERLSLLPRSAAPGVSFVSAQSASTLATFFFTYPADSSRMAAARSTNRYPVAEFYENAAPFELSLKMPPSEGNSYRMVSNPGLSADSYNEVVAVQYAGRDGAQAVFDVKCRYQMHMRLLPDTANTKPVSGTFHFKVRTTGR